MISEIRVTDEDTGGEKGMKMARFDLIPVEAEWALAEHYGKNSTSHGGKYEDNNWRKGYRWSLSYGAMMRHRALFWMGEDIDPDSKSHHCISVAWHAFTLYVFSLFGIGKDDRPKSMRPQAMDAELAQRLHAELNAINAEIKAITEEVAS